MCLYFAQTHFFCTFGAKYKNVCMEKLIGRKAEVKALQQYAKSGKAEFVALTFCPHWSIFGIIGLLGKMTSCLLFVGRLPHG